MSDEELATRALVKCIQKLMIEEAEPIARFRGLLEMAETASKIYLSDHPEDKDVASVQMFFMLDIMKSYKTAMMNLAEEMGEGELVERLRNTSLDVEFPLDGTLNLAGFRDKTNALWEKSSPSKHKGVERIFLTGNGDPTKN